MWHLSDDTERLSAYSTSTLVYSTSMLVYMRRFVFGGAAKTLFEMGLLSGGPEQASQR